MFGPVHPEIIRCSRCCNPWSPDGHVCGDRPKGALTPIRWISWPFMSECPKDEATYQVGLAVHREREYDRKVAAACGVFLREAGYALIAACIAEAIFIGIDPHDPLGEGTCGPDYCPEFIGAGYQFGSDRP